MQRNRAKRLRCQFRRKRLELLNRETARLLRSLRRASFAARRRALRDSKTKPRDQK